MEDNSAVLALILGIGGTLISLALGYAVFTVAKPSNGYLDSWEKSPHNYGRLWLAYTLGLLFFSFGSLAIFLPAELTIIAVLVIIPIFSIPAGLASYLLGYLYGKSKQKINQSAKINQFVKETNKTLERASKKTTKQSIKKSVNSPQDQTTKNNLPKNQTIDEKNTDDMDDEEYYLIATKEVEGSNRDDARWAKAMATQMGDETKAKAYYVNKRVLSLKVLKKQIRKEIYETIERNGKSTSDNPENDLTTDNLFPNSPNAHYREKIIAKFKQKVEERLEKELNLKSD